MTRTTTVTALGGGALARPGPVRPAWSCWHCCYSWRVPPCTAPAPGATNAEPPDGEATYIISRSLMYRHLPVNIQLSVKRVGCRRSGSAPLGRAGAVVDLAVVVADWPGLALLCEAPQLQDRRRDADGPRPSFIGGFALVLFTPPRHASRGSGPECTMSRRDTARVSTTYKRCSPPVDHQRLPALVGDPPPPDVVALVAVLTRVGAEPEAPEKYGPVRLLRQFLRAGGRPRSASRRTRESVTELQN